MKRQHQKGVAVVTALLLTALAITIVASLFWQQQVQVRSIENQRFQLQKKWVLRGALDWAGLILREDARTSLVDHLGEPWAINLGETRLDQYVENGRTEVEDSEATLSGQISDAQAKFNLTNLATNGEINVPEVLVFAKLLRNLRLDSSLAEQVATQVAATQEKQIQTGTPNPSGSTTPASITSPTATNAGVGALNTTSKSPVSTLGLSATDSSTVQFLSFSQTDDLLIVPGFDAQMLKRLKNFVTVLPGPEYRPVNVNTTSAEVLSACLEKVSMSDAALMIAARDRAYFIDQAKFDLNFPDKVKPDEAKRLSFQTDYFVVNGKVKLNRSFLEVNALFKRDKQGTKVLWVREN